jgi:hypothetical protein
MAFQTGTTVDPRLGQLDYSGFARAGEIEGQAMAQAGASIASGIEGYKKKKKEQKIGQAKINRSIAFGESMIEMLGKDNPLSNSIADSLSINFGDEVPFEQRVAATEGLSTEITNMFLMSQKNQAPTFTPGPQGGMIVNMDGENKYYSPYQMEGRGSGYEAFGRMLNDNPTPTPTPPAPLTPEDLEEEARLMRLNQ